MTSQRHGTASSWFAGGWLAACLLGVANWSFAAQDAVERSAVSSVAEEPAEESEDDLESPYQNGVIASYTGSDGVTCRRLEDEISIAREMELPDRRLSRGSWSARFNGRLQIQTAGKYRLRAFAVGSLRIELAGKVLLEAVSREPAWLDAAEVELPFGYHPLVVDFRRTDGKGQLALYWEGPQFALEPLAGRWLYHETADTPSAAFEQGEQLVRALRCAACHQIPGEPKALPAPALDSLAGNLSRAWLVQWLTTRSGELAPTTSGSGVARRMPHFEFDAQGAEAVADYLFANSQPLAAPAAVPPPSAPALSQKEKEKAKKKNKDAPIGVPPVPNLAAGGTLFRSLGCLACHRVGPLGADGLFGGGDLAKVAEKRPAGFFAGWLADPARFNRDHRMPLFGLDPFELESLSLYLQSLGSTPASANGGSTARAERGRELVEQARCAACHVLPTMLPQGDGLGLKLDAAAVRRSTKNCLSEPDGAAHRPGYRLAAPAREAVATFLSENRATEIAAERGKQLLVERNCLACHARGRARGLANHLPAIAETEPALRDLLPALAPPALFGVGDKLHEQALVASIVRSQPPRRNWLRVRMPKFPLDDAEARELAQHFISNDRIPDRRRGAGEGALSVEDASRVDATVEAAGARLVTADGFGCTSCHAIGKWQPSGVALNASGANLSQIGERVRHAWFNRWVRNPARIVPQMEMPAVVQPARGVLNGKLDEQLASVWQVLNRSGFTPPSPNALRVVRRANMPSVVEQAAVLTEVIEVSGRPFVKPLVVGLPNRHNVLVDLSHGRLAAWWIGDTGRQTTRGKSWHWEAGGAQLLALPPRDSTPACELSLLRKGSSLAPSRQGDYVTEYDSCQHVGEGIAITHRLHFASEEKGAADNPTCLHVIQRFSPVSVGPDGSGFLREVEIADLSKDESAELIVLSADAMLDADGKRVTLAGRGGRLQVALRAPAGGTLTKSERGIALVLNGTPAACELEYRADVAVDQFAPQPELDRSVTRETLDVVPGFEAVRLPVTDRAMPTGLAWRDDGTLVVCSLEGRVWLGRDTDGDGLEDQLLPFSDDLAAPFGVATSGDAIDVSNKYGLLRLTDRDHDGHADRTELLASGWGHTLDYHDWAVGLPRDAEGIYYLSLACQQDRRTAAGAALRGSVIKLTPRAVSSDDPRRYAVEPLAGGLRFAQGIALSKAGDLFVTDNQGNYTPFNELNHIVAGARYGFLNRWESEQGLNPPHRAAAVEIPHPWTRSVNGICFLETPAAVREQLGHDLYGPLAGQLIGCEYDTRRLVRMSLERVAGEFQGAVYPLSSEPAAGAETFEGPLVCQVAPGGDVYVGSIRDSGWGAGSNTGSLVRLRWKNDLPAGIAEIKAAASGFTIDFTVPVDRDKAGRGGNYSVVSYRRTPTPNYGGPDQDRRVEPITSVHVSDDARRATLQLDSLREGFVYEFHVRDVGSGGRFFPNEAYYTLRHRLP